MIRSHKSRWFTRWFARSCERRLRATFDVAACGLPEVATIARTHPLVLVSNHTCWWDPLVILVVSARVLGLDAFALMESDNLRRLPFFGLAGAIGLHRGDVRDGAKAVRYAATLLDAPMRAVWIFPQGEERPAHEPLRFSAGAARVARIAGARIVPVALRYGFGSRARPELAIACGPAIDPRRSDATELARDRVAGLLAAIDERALPLSPLWPAPAQRRERFATALLARFAARWIAAREATAAADPQRAIGPAHATGRERAHERGEQEQVDQQRVREVGDAAR